MTWAAGGCEECPAAAIGPATLGITVPERMQAQGRFG